MNENFAHSESETPAEGKRKMPSHKTIGVIVAVVVLAGLLYVYRGVFVAATVNSHPISRLAVIQRLEKTSGKQVLDALITESLIKNELDKNNVAVGSDEINKSIATIEEGVKQQGGDLDTVLKQQGYTRSDLEDQIMLQMRLKKFFGDKLNVSDDEITKYIADNKIPVPQDKAAQIKEQIRNQLQADKLNQATGEWLNTLRDKASIHYFVNY